MCKVPTVDLLEASQLFLQNCGQSNTCVGETKGSKSLSAPQGVDLMERTEENAKEPEPKREGQPFILQECRGCRWGITNDREKY